jgi:hypothetical protein
MKRTTLVLLLFLTIFNHAELKQNILTQIEEEPILLANEGALRNEAAKAVRNLFGFSFDFSKTLLEREVVIHSGNPIITAKLSTKCSTSISLGKNSGTMKVKNSAIISQSGTKLNLSSSSIASVNNNLKIDLQKASATLTGKLKTAVGDGIVNFTFSLTEAKFQFIFSKTQSNTSCDGSLTITIKPGSNTYISQGKPATQPAVSTQAIQQAASTVATGGAIAVGAVLLYKLVKGVAGFFVGGPVGALIGVAT